MTGEREPITRFEGPAVALRRDNVDTDQIIPARFLKTISRAGLGEHLFADWRMDAKGTPRAGFILNAPEAAGARVLVAGANFGCGSSREHAPWALTGYGFRAVVAASFADIFGQNALKNGLLPIVIPAPAHDELLALVASAPGTVVTVDLPRQVIGWQGGREEAFAIDPFAKQCLVSGVDEIGYVLQQEDAIARYESSRSSWDS